MSARKAATFLGVLLALVTQPGVAAGQVAPSDEAERREGTTPLAAPATPSIPIAFGGYFWVDTGLMQRTNRAPGTFDQDANYMQGRFVLRSEYVHELGGLTALARLELAGLVEEFGRGQYAPLVLDSYVQVGQRRWDLQLGRFLAWEVYYRGQGIELYTPEEAGASGTNTKAAPAPYLLNFTRGHTFGPGQAAVHLYPLDALGIEVAAVYGQVPDQQNYLGVRPVADFRLGGLGITGGYEYLKVSAQRVNDRGEETLKGYAGRLQYRFGAPYLTRPGELERLARGGVPPGVTIGVNFAQATVDRILLEGIVDTRGSLDRTSAGGFVDVDVWRSSVGLGYHRTVQKNLRGEEDTQDQAFVSYLHRLPLPGLSVKAVYSLARARLEDIDASRTFENDLQSFRVRVAYEFL
jgi:hypothetical protein